MKSDPKLRVEIGNFDRSGGKHWVMVRLPGRDWVPSFHDLFEIIFGICFCEDKKYSRVHQQGRFKVRNFLKDCCEVCRPGQTPEERWEELKAKYKLDK